jgi:general secretion pathway protein G
MKYKLNSGFTLIELLVVISIIGVLATLIMANFVGVRERARDAQRKNDINQIQKALEMYKQSQSVPQYPAALPTLAPAYIKDAPHDPNYINNNSWDYVYTSPSVGTDKLTYELVTCLENKSDPQAISSPAAGYNTKCTGLGGNISITRNEP